MSIKSIHFSPSKSEAISRTLAERFGERFFEHYNLSTLVPLQVGGVADYLLLAQSVDDIIEATRLAYSWRLPYRVVGATSGVIFSDVGFPGLVIVNQTASLNLVEGNKLVAQSGTSNDNLVNWAAARGLGGLEFLAVIPGSIGGAVVTRASWGAKQIESFVREVAVFWPAARAKSDEVVSLVVDESVWQLLDSALDPEVSFPPVVLGVTIQASQMYPDAVIERLRATRHLVSPPAARTLGYVFTSKTPPDLLASKSLRTVLDGIALDRLDRNRIIVQSRLNSATIIRESLEKLRLYLASQMQQPLAYRLGYLGYWPKEEEDEKKSD